MHGLVGLQVNSSHSELVTRWTRHKSELVTVKSSQGEVLKSSQGELVTGAQKRNSELGTRANAINTQQQLTDRAHQQLM